MTFQPVTFDRFRGLNLADDPQELGGEQARDLLNVEFDRRGRLKTRRGFVQFDTNGTTQAFDELAPSGAYLLGAGVPSGTNLIIYRIDTAGTITTLATLALGNIMHLSSSAQIGSPTATYTYLAIWRNDTNGGSTLQRYDNATTVANSVGQPKFVAAWQNRLVQAGYVGAATSPSGANGSMSTVFFSDAGATDTYTASNFVHLSPGDGEVITAMAVWRGDLYVFKQTQMFVFPGGGIGTDGTGGAVFNYRTVTLGCNIVPSPTGFVSSAIAGANGVYLSTFEGIYRTTGDVPIKVSDALEPLFDGTVSGSVYWGDGLLVYVNSSFIYPWLVMDEHTGEWTAWDTSGRGTAFGRLVNWRVNGRARMYFSVGGMHVYSMDRAATTDDGVAITWRWQSGWYDLGLAGVKTTRWTRLWGSGWPVVSVFTDMSTDADAREGTVILGTAPAVAEGYHLQAYRGQLFSHNLAGFGAATIHRVQHDVAGVQR